MIVLALDTAGTGCFAAVYDGDGQVVLGSAGADIGKGHAERLMAFVEEALSKSGKTLDDVGRIAVNIGPGSFTGIRVGVAVARGFALALGVPAVGVSTFAGLADMGRRAHPGQAILVAMDARREEIYLQAFDAAGHAVTEPAILSVADARQEAATFGGVVYGSGASVLAGAADEVLSPGDTVEIGTIARLGLAADAGQAKPKPLYLRGPGAQPQAGFAVSRV